MLAPAYSQGQPTTSSISDQKLDQAAAAMTRVNSLHKSYQQKLTETSPDQQDRVIAEANNALQKAVTDQGLSVDEYNTIIKTAQNDPAIRDKLVQRIGTPKESCPRRTARRGTNRTQGGARKEERGRPRIAGSSAANGATATARQQFKCGSGGSMASSASQARVRTRAGESSSHKPPARSSSAAGASATCRSSPGTPACRRRSVISPEILRRSGGWWR
jgi:Domain of unknown function (DUF4168)